MKTVLLYRSYYSSSIVMAKTNKPQSQKGSDQSPPRITSNVKQNLQFLKLWREFQKQKSNTPKPATSYRKKKVQKEELPEDNELYQDPTSNLYYTNQGLETAVPVLLVDGYNVCGYWPKLKKHFMKGRLDIARQKLIDELITFSVLKDVWRGDLPLQARFLIIASLALDRSIMIDRCFELCGEMVERSPP